MLPILCDENKTDLRREKKPVDPWNWIFHNGFYYPKLTGLEADNKVELHNLSKKFGKNFESTKQFLKYVESSTRCRILHGLCIKVL